MLLEKSLLAHNLAKYFIDIVAGDTYVEKKPNPVILEKIIDNICDLNKILIIGDSEIDERLAKNAGIDYYHYNGGYGNAKLLNQCHVFDDYSKFNFGLINQYFLWILEK